MPKNELRRRVSVFAPVRKNSKDVWEVFLQKRDENAVRNPGNYGLWGGGIEKGETPEDALLREIKEELSYTIRFFKPLGFKETPDLEAYRYFGPVEKNFDSMIEVREGQYGKWFTEEMIAIEEKMHERTRETLGELFRKLEDIKSFLPNDEYLKTLPRIRSGSAVLLSSNGRYLLAKRTYSKYWAMPGGTVDHGESPRQTAKRELFEEIGFRLKIKRLLVVEYLHKKGNDDESYQFVFWGGEISERFLKKAVIRNDEIAEIRLFSLREVKKYVTPTQLARIRHAVKVLKDPSVPPYMDYTN